MRQAVRRELRRERRRTLRVAAGLLAAFSFSIVAAPALCMAGVLEHACNCEIAAPENDCTSDCACDCTCDGADGCTDGCSHDGCENDPCRTRLTTKTARSDAIRARLAELRNEVLPSSPPAHFAIVFSLVPARLERYRAAGPPGSRARLPYHSSDVPLRR